MTRPEEDLPMNAPRPSSLVGAASALSVRGLTKSYGARDEDERPALSPLTLEVPAGQLVALVGHNGSGKTTFVRMVAGLLDPTGGTVTVFDAARGSIDARARLAYLADQPTFYDDLSVLEHIEFAARLHGRDSWRAAADEVLGALGLTHRADDLPTTFSRGLRQKAAIAIGMVRPFDVLLVDEPFVGLDQAGKAALVDLLARAGQAGATLVVATHELNFVSHVERLIALRDGALVFDGPPGEADVEQLVKPG